MDAEGEPRKELLNLVRSLKERLQVDGELGRPLSYLTRLKVDVADMGSSSDPGGSGGACRGDRFEWDRFRSGGGPGGARRLPALFIAPHTSPSGIRRGQSKGGSRFCRRGAGGG